MFKAWRVELITNTYTCNNLELKANKVEKLDYQELDIDGVIFRLPDGIGMSFGEVEEVQER